MSILVVLVGIAMGVAPASAQTDLAFTEDPLPGSTFQGGDGNQTDAPARVDWQSLGGVGHVEDFNPADTAFTGGSNETNPGEWGLETANNGVGPPADNIRDVWAAVNQPGDDSTDTFAYLAFSRDGSGGTHYLAFELNRDHRLWFNGKAMIPCRLTNDLLITYETHGNVPRVQVREWETTDPDEGTGCARRGGFVHPVDVDASNAQGQLNPAAIPAANNFLPGAFAGQQIPSGQFGEASLNLADIAEELFGDRCLAYSSIWMHSRASQSLTSQKKDFVAPQRLPVRSCAASGTKFWDANADGVRQLDGSEPGLPRWKIWADYDGDGRHDRATEPFDITDDDGEYLIFGIRAGGDFTLRETVLRQRRRSWVCSHPTTTAPGGRFPCAHPDLDFNDDAYIQGADFGNWFPARLTLEKVLFPPTDPGRFDLLVDGTVRLAGAGDGSRRTIRLPPGAYDVSEQGAARADGTLTDLLAYTTTVDCQPGVDRPGEIRDGTVFTGLELVAGARATCTFTNVRAGEPAIAIRKSAPATATAGDTLRYRFVVTNPGTLPIRGVTVTDPRCDEAPELVEKRRDGEPDPTPETLDPGDAWEYACSRRTAEPGPDCETRTIENTGTVTGTADNGQPVTADDTKHTTLLCPDPDPGPGPGPDPGPGPGPGPGPDPDPGPDPVPLDPPGPEPPRPPDVPGPVVPPGPRPPEAGVAGRAAFLSVASTRRCVRRRVHRVRIRGSRLARVSIFVNRHLRRRITLGALRGRVAPRVTLAAGRNRVDVRVVFHAGAGMPPVTLTRLVRVCPPPAAAPRFTG